MVLTPSGGIWNRAKAGGRTTPWHADEAGEGSMVLARAVCLHLLLRQKDRRLLLLLW